MSDSFDRQPVDVRVEDGLQLYRDRRIGNEGSPYWYRVPNLGTWQDWVQLAQAIIAAENDRKATIAKVTEKAIISVS